MTTIVNYLNANNDLTSIDLSFNDLTDNGLKILSTAKNLTAIRLTMNGSSISENGSTALAELPQLSSLNLSYDKVSGGLNALAKNHSLMFGFILYKKWEL